MAELIEVEQEDGCQMCLGAKGGVPGNENRLGDLLVCDYCTSALLPALATMQAREAELVGEVARLKRQIGDKDRALHEKNLALDAMGWVWCDGGCRGGTGRFTDFQLAEEHVAMMERQAKRARSYLGNKDYRADSNQERVR